MKKIALIGMSIALVAWLLYPLTQERTRKEIRVVGSSTVFPFVAAVAEQFGREKGRRTPIVETTGTGGGFKLFCAGVGEQFPDVSNASRPIKESERAMCAGNGIQQLAELMLGYDGIVLGNAIEGQMFALSKQELFLALAKEVPAKGVAGKKELIANPYVMWSDIHHRLPKVEIRVYGPPPTSGTRDAFVELVMDEACQAFSVYKALYPEKKVRKGACRSLREDGHFIEAGENDNIIVQKLQASPDSLGIFGYSFLEQNAALVKPAKIDGVVPTFGAIASGRYGVARSLHVYVKRDHETLMPDLMDFARALVDEDAAGMDGYLTLKGLIPLQKKALRVEQEKLL